MHIAFLSNQDPKDIHLWSGTTNHIYKTLCSRHKVDWLGGGILQGAKWYHHYIGAKDKFYPENYTHFFSRILSPAINRGGYDAVFIRDYYLGVGLKTDALKVYVTDATFDLFRDYLGIDNQNYASLAEDTERTLFEEMDLLVFSSHWAMGNAVSHYGVAGEKCCVIPFGANIPDPVDISEEMNTDACNLLFIGRNWEKKGGPKVLETYRILRSRGMAASLTIIGSEPKVNIKDPNVKVIPYIDKFDPLQLKDLDRLFRRSHFLVQPTTYDAFGICFCEASAYGIPSIAANVGGVSEPVRKGKNGYLLPQDAAPSDYANLIYSIFQDKAAYMELRKSSRQEYLLRLNWNAWINNVDKYMKRTLERKEQEEDEDFYIPVYAINLKERKDRRLNLQKQFEGKDEFRLTIMEAVKDADGRLGLWMSMKAIVKTAMNNDEDIIIICEDDHEFTRDYSLEYMLNNIVAASKLGLDMLSGGIGGYGQAVRISGNLYWTDWFWCTQFVILFKPIYKKILDYQFKTGDTADGILSKITFNRAVMFPFISVQRDFGYSDVTETNDRIKGLISNHFKSTQVKLGIVQKAYEHFYSKGMQS